MTYDKKELGDILSPNDRRIIGYTGLVFAAALAVFGAGITYAEWLMKDDISEKIMLDKRLHRNAYRERAEYINEEINYDFRRGGNPSVFP